MTVLIPFVGFSQTWQKTFGSNANEVATSIIATQTGKYLVAGYSDDNCSFVLQLDLSGTIEWQKRYTFGTTPLVFNKIISSSSGGYLICGYTGQPWIDFKPRLIKLDGAGNVSFSKEQNTYGYSKALFENSNNEIFTGGFSPSIAKYNSIGDTIWTKKHEDNNSFAIEYSDIVSSNDSEYFAVGNLNTIALPVITKFNSNGDTIWHRQEWFATHQAITSAIALNDGGIVTVLKDGNIFKWDSSGSVLWGKNYQGAIFKVILKNPNGGFYCAGNNSNDFFLLKIGDAGNLVWAKTYGSPLTEDLLSATIDVNSNIILVGSTLGFGAIGNDIYVVKVDSLGNSSCNVTSGNFLVTNSTITTSSHLVITPGCAHNSATLTEITNNYSDSLLCTTVMGTNQISSVENTIHVSPNPFSSSTTLQPDKVFKGATLIIYNSYGQQLKKINNLSGTAFTLYRDNLTRGVYYFRLLNENNPIASGKLVITDN